MKKLTILIVGVMVFIVIGVFGYLLYSSNQNFLIYKNQVNINTQKNEQQQSNLAFEQKQKCETYREDITDKITKYDSNLTLKHVCDTSWQGTSYCADSLTPERFVEIFYSPKLNTCLYLKLATTFFKGEDPDQTADPSNSEVVGGDKFFTDQQVYSLNDALTGSKIDEALTEWRNTPMELMKDNTPPVNSTYPGVVERMLEKYK